MHSPAHQLVPTMHVYRFTVGCDNIVLIYSIVSLMPKVMRKTVDIGHEMEYMLATGNLRSRSGLGLQQVEYSSAYVCNANIITYIILFSMKIAF